jgi:hypothetical protein
MFLKKKAALELSVNAIVVLIMAILILGLGIGFTKFMMDSATNQFKNINKDIASRMTQNLKESTDRLKLDPNNMEIEKGKNDKEIYFGLRNELDRDLTFSINGAGNIDIMADPGKWKGDDSVITCFTAFDSTAKLSGNNNAANTIYFKADKKINIKKGEIYVSKIVVAVSGRAPTGTYTCSLIIEDPVNAGEEYTRADFMITVPE